MKEPTTGTVYRRRKPFGVKAKCTIDNSLIAKVDVYATGPAILPFNESDFKLL